MLVYNWLAVYFSSPLTHLILVFHFASNVEEAAHVVELHSPISATTPYFVAVPLNLCDGHLGILGVVIDIDNKGLI